MKIKYLYVIFILCIVFITSCNKDFLDKKSMDVVSEDVAFTNVSGIEALTANLYQSMPVEDFDFIVATDAGYPSTTCDEAVRSYIWGEQNDPVIGDGWFGWWGYDKVRQVNDFLEKIANATIDKDLKTRFTAEAKFIRAYYYFAMVKRYGGVPLITSVQHFNGANLDEVKVPRNTEKEIYDFVAKECDDAASILPESYETRDRHRATRYAALALKSRAMLYAASIAKYGTVQLNGLAGIPSANANSYWQKSYKASQDILGHFELYNGNPNKAANFQELFLKEADNKEVIMAKVYQTPDFTHSFDFYNAPQSFKIDWGCVTNPTLELVEEFEYTDGSPGQLKVNDAITGNPIEYSNPVDLFKDKDPRLLASILTPFAPWQGGIVEIRRGVVRGGEKITAGNLTDTIGSGANSITIVGKDGPLTENDPTKTGFYIKKFMDPVNRLAGGKSTTPWYIFRYGEVLLNFAEAAVELGKTDSALWAMNEIRKRAGIAELTSINLEQVRHERKVELAFENQRWWDIRRWRIASDVLNNTQFHALYPWLMWEEGKSPAEMKYTFEIVEAPKNTRTFPSKLYYEIIDPGEITKNSKLVQNPGY